MGSTKEQNKLMNVSFNPFLAKYAVTSEYAWADFLGNNKAENGPMTSIDSRE